MRARAAWTVPWWATSSLVVVPWSLGIEPGLYSLLSSQVTRPGGPPPGRWAPAVPIAPFKALLVALSRALRTSLGLGVPSAGSARVGAGQAGMERVVSDWAAVAEAVNGRLSKLGMTQKELAKRSRVSVATLRKIQKGVAQDRSDAILSAVSRALGFPDDHLRSLADGAARRSSTVATADTDLRSEVADLRRRVEALEEATSKKEDS